MGLLPHRMILLFQSSYFMEEKYIVCTDLYDKLIAGTLWWRLFEVIRELFMTIFRVLVL